MYLTTEQIKILQENCSEYLAKPLPLIRSRHSNNVKVFSVNKVRVKHVPQTVVGKVTEDVLGIRDVDNRSVLVDWSNLTNDSVYIFPFNGWGWFPSVYVPGIQNVNESIIRDIVKLKKKLTLEEAVESKSPIGLVGINKFISIRTKAYPNFKQLLQEITSVKI